MPSTKQDLERKIAWSTRAGTAFPSPANAGDPFYRTDLNEYYVYNGTAWVPWRTRGYTIVVAASNSIDPTLADPAYRCDGTADQAEINAAITALGATGGAVILLDGTFAITASVTLASNVALVGQGAGTVLRVPDGHDANLNVIYGNGIDHVLVTNLKVDGNKAGQSAGNMHGIYFDTVTHSKVVDCWVEDMYGTAYGIYLLDSSEYNTITGNTCQGNGNYGANLSSSNHNTITGNTFQGNTRHGINLSSSNNNTITGNTCQGNTLTGIYVDASSNNTVAGNTCQGNSGYGICIHGASYNTVAGNTCQGNGDPGIGLDGTSNHNTVTGNTCQGNSGYGGIVMDDAHYNTVTGNTCQGNDESGINLYYASYNTVAGNTFQGNGTHGIWMEDAAHYNTVEGNTVEGNSQTTDDTYDGIMVDGDSDYNNIQGNKVRQGVEANRQQYGININAATCDENFVIANDLDAAGVSGNLNDSGSATIVRDNRGWVTENNVLSPAFAIDAAAVVTVTIPHGLDVTPTLEDCQLTIVKDTAVDDWEEGFVRVESVDAANVVAKVNVKAASGTVGATAKLALHVDLTGG